MKRQKTKKCSRDKRKWISEGGEIQTNKRTVLRRKQILQPEQKKKKNRNWHYNIDWLNLHWYKNINKRVHKSRKNCQE